MIELSAGFIISVANYVSESTYEDVVAEFETAQFPVSLERRDPEVFAAFQFLMPTAVVVYLLKPYVDKFISKMAEDNYDSCKLAVKKLWSHFLARDRTFRSRLIGTQGKVFDSDLAIELSFVAKTTDEQYFRLLFPQELSAPEFQKAILGFYSLMEEHDRAPQTSVLKRLGPVGRKGHYPRVLTWVPNEGRLVEVDIIQSSLQKTLVTVAIPPKG